MYARGMSVRDIRGHLEELYGIDVSPDLISAIMALLGGAAAPPSLLWPLAARAQQPDRVRRIGVLMHLAADDPESPTRIAALRQGLQQFGWAEGGNVRIDYRWAKGQADLFRQGAKELVQLAPDVLVASTSLAVPALQEGKSARCRSSSSMSSIRLVQDLLRV